MAAWPVTMFAGDGGATAAATPLPSRPDCGSSGRGIVRTWLVALTAVGLAGFASAGEQQPTTGASRSMVRGDAPAAYSSVPGALSTASESATELAKKVQNPVSDAYILPLQNNTNFNVGPQHGTGNILNIQPVLPVHLNDDWKVITKAILPLTWNPSFQPRQSVPFGTGPTTLATLLSPVRPVDGWVWGAGPIAQLPTITNKALGSNVWGLGPAFVIVKLAGPIVAGTYVNNAFSVSGTSGPGGTRYGLLTVNPFAHYNFGNGWFMSSSPTITANEMSGGAKWTVPVGLQVGRLIKIGGRLPVNLLAGAYYNVLRPEYGAPWEIRSVAAFIF